MLECFDGNTPATPAKLAVISEMEVDVQVERCKNGSLIAKNKVVSFFLPFELTATQKLCKL